MEAKWWCGLWKSRWIKSNDQRLWPSTHDWYTQVNFGWPRKKKEDEKEGDYWMEIRTESKEIFWLLMFVFNVDSQLEGLKQRHRCSSKKVCIRVRYIVTLAPPTFSSTMSEQIRVFMKLESSRHFKKKNHFLCILPMKFQNRFGSEVDWRNRPKIRNPFL